MNASRLAVLSIALPCVVTTACGQPAQVLKEAVQWHAAADNYTWEQVIETDSNGGRMSEKSWGKTAVDGYTVATVGGLPAVFRGNDSVFELKTGWRHVRDLAADELHQLRRVLGAPTARNFVYIPIHDMLHALAGAVIDVWQHEAVIRGDVPFEFERHLMTGTLPSAAALRSVLGTPRRTSSSGSGARATPSRPNGALSVWVKDGNVTKVSVEFAHTFTNPRGPRQGELTTLIRSYTVELSRIGKTNVDVPPDANALFVK